MNNKNRVYKVISLAFIIIFISLICNSNINARELSCFNRSIKNIVRKPTSINENKENKNKENETIKEKKEKTKKIFLTFDDGPSINNTRKIIKILNDNNVKATFFVIGCKSEEYSDIIKELKESKMSIQSHTYSHDYKIYKSVDKYIADLEKCKDSIKNLTGKKSGVYVRIPGGSDNLVAKKYVLRNIRKRLIEDGMYYVDWNVSSGDAAGYNIPEYKIQNNIKKQCKDKNFAVVLMHDSYYKRTTVEALPKIIKYLKREGFQFKTFDDITEKEKQTMINMRIINRKEKKRKNKH